LKNEVFTVKNKIAILLAVLTVLSVALAIGYRMYRTSQSSPMPPVITFEEGVPSVKTNASDAELLQGVTAYDPEDGDVTASLVVESVSSMTGKNNVTVSYVAFDSKNHMTRAARTVHFTDYTDPVFALTQALCFKLSNNIDILDYVKVNDVVDGDISGQVKYSLLGDTVSLSTVGEYEAELRVTNSLGRTIHLTVPVVITQTDPNSAKITLDKYLIYLDKGEEFNARDHVVSYIANNSLRESADGLTISGSVDTSKSGTYIVTYTYYGSPESSTRLIVIVA